MENAIGRWQGGREYYRPDTHMCSGSGTSKEHLREGGSLLHPGQEVWAGTTQTERATNTGSEKSDLPPREGGLGSVAGRTESTHRLIPYLARYRS